MTADRLSPQRRLEIVDALRRGTVPRAGLDAFAVGLDHFASAFDEEFARVGSGGSAFKAIRGEYGSGKTFAARWLESVPRQIRTRRSKSPKRKRPLSLQTVSPPNRAGLDGRRVGRASGGVIERWFFKSRTGCTRRGWRRRKRWRRCWSAPPPSWNAGSDHGDAPAFAAVLRSYRQAVGRGDAPRRVAAGLSAGSRRARR